MQTGLPIAKIGSLYQNYKNVYSNFKYVVNFFKEFLDENSIIANNKYNKMSLDETPTLFLEFHGSEDTIDSQAKLASNITT